MGGGWDRIQTVNTTHLVVLAGFHISQLVLRVMFRVSDKCRVLHNCFVTGED
jgi:hypothetical protein